MGNNGHVPNVLRVVHETTDLAAQSVFHPTHCHASQYRRAMRGRCVRTTYLLDREAVMLLAIV